MTTLMLLPGYYIVLITFGQENEINKLLWLSSAYTIISLLKTALTFSNKFSTLKTLVHLMPFNVN